MKRMVTTVLVMLAAAVATGGGVATVTVGSDAVTHAVASQYPPNRYYAYTQADQRADCYRAARVARGVPANRAAYTTWWNNPANAAAVADWHQAYEACQASYPGVLTLVRVGD